MKSNKKTRFTHYLITIVALSAVLFCFAGCSKKTPREALEDAYETTFIENNPTDELLGMIELNEKLENGTAYSSGFSATIQEISGVGLDNYAGLLTGLGININSASDAAAKKSAGTLDITYGGTSQLTLGGQLQDTQFHLTVPQLLDGSVYVDVATIREDLASDSMLGRVLQENNIVIPEDFESSFSDAFSEDSLSDITAILSAVEDLNESLLIEEADKKAVSLPSDVSAKKVYSVTIPQHAYVAAVNAVLDTGMNTSAAVSDELSQEDYDLVTAKAEFQKLADQIGNIVVYVAVNKTGYITYAVSNIGFGEGSMALSAAFTGKKNPLTDMKITTTVTADDITAEAVLTESLDTETGALSFAMTATLNDDTLFTLSAEGNYTNVEKGKKYTLDYDYIDLDVMEVFSVSLAADSYVDTTTCEIPALPSATKNLCRMTDSEFLVLAAEVSTNVYEHPLLGPLFGLQSGSEY